MLSCLYDPIFTNYLQVPPLIGQLFFFFFKLWLNFFFVSYLYFYVAVNPKFESPKKKNNNSAAARPDPWILLIFETVQPFPDGELEVEEEEERKKNKGFSTRISKLFTIFQDIPSLIHANEFSPPLALYFFWSKILPFHHQTIKNMFLCW